jgi:isopenicillin N synthase-like dioxygenase
MAQIPLIDIGPFLDGGPSDKQAVAKKVNEVCCDIGFLVVEGHGVSESLIVEMYEVSEEYFALPFWEKMRFKMPPGRYRGYTPMGTEGLALSLDDETPPDLKESFSMGPFAHPYDEYHFSTAGAHYFAPNMWPDQPTRMRGLWEQYYSKMEELAGNLMRIFAVALSMPETTFDDKIDRHITNFSVIRYPDQESIEPAKKQLRAGAHTDYGSLTIVHTNTDVGGLEVMTEDGNWEGVPWVPNGFIVNIGDLMAEWTNDRWVSTLHRVANPPRDRASTHKTSLLFFHQPNYDAIVECIPTCVSADKPARYGRTTSGEHVTMKIEKHRIVEDA